MSASSTFGEARSAALSVVVVVLVLAAHVLWVSWERGPMLWDNAMYAAASLEIYDGLDAKGLPGLFERFIHVPSGEKAPLICLMPVPLFLVFGRGSEWAFQAVGLLGFALVCLTAYRLVRRLSNGFGAFVAVVLLCFTPLIAGLTRQFMVEIPLLAAVLCWHERLLRSEFLERPREEGKLGVILGIGMLLKVTFPLFILGSVLAGIGLRVLRGPEARRALWNWKGGAVLAVGGIAIAAATVGLRGLSGYVAAGLPIALALLVRRHWTGRLPPGTERFLVILGIAYLVAGVWYSENLTPLLRTAWEAGFGEPGRRYDTPLADYVAQICSFGVSNLQLALLAVGAAALFVTKKRLAGLDSEEGDPAFGKAARWTLFLWLALPLPVFLASHNRVVRLTLPCLAAVPIAGGLLGAELWRRSRRLSTLWAGACTVLGGALFVSYSFGVGPVERLALGPWVFWGRALDWDQRPPDPIPWPHQRIVLTAAGMLADHEVRTVFLLFNQPRLNWLNLTLAAQRERLKLDFDYAGRFAGVEAAAQRAATVSLFLAQEGGETGPEWTEAAGRGLVARLTSGELGPVVNTYDVRLPDGGDLHFYQRAEKAPEERLDPLPSCHVLFGDRITLVGLDLRREVGSLQWLAAWKVERDLYDDYSVYLHFVDGQGRLFARDHALTVAGRGTRGRRKGDILREECVIPLDSEIRDSRVLHAGVYQLDSLAKFPVRQSTLPLLEGRDGISLKLPESSSDSSR